tara:strand:+ start:158 stop:706 length:549 start_codon:yes stop_codon:yes gene_type:complete
MEEEFYKLKDIDWVQSILKILGIYEYRILGGAPRDLALGSETFKDIDVFISIYSKLNKNISHIQEKLYNLTMDYTVHSSYNGDESTSELIPVVIKVGGLDIILYNVPLEDIQDYFDYNINQFELFGGKLPIYVGEGQITELKTLKHARPNIDRVQRMAEMYGRHNEKFYDISETSWRGRITY